MVAIDYPVQIALLDDHPLFRQGLRYILQTLPYVAGVFDTGEFAPLLAHCRQRLPDILLLDLQLPGTDGSEVARQLLGEFPDLKIIVLSMFSADKFITQMLKLGVRSYLPKDVDDEQLRLALAEVLSTGYHTTPRMAQALLNNEQRPATPPRPLVLPRLVQLTPREEEILHLICGGHTAADIADRLFISRRTVEGHRQKLLEKTSAPNSAGLVLYAARHGLLDN